MLLVAVWRQSRDGADIFIFFLFHDMPCSITTTHKNKLTRWIVPLRTKVKILQRNVLCRCKQFFPVKLRKQTKNCTSIFECPIKNLGTDRNRKHRNVLISYAVWLMRCRARWKIIANEDALRVFVECDKLCTCNVTDSVRQSRRSSAVLWRTRSAAPATSCTKNMGGGVAVFRQKAANFRQSNERKFAWVIKSLILPQYFPKIRDFQLQISYFRRKFSAKNTILQQANFFFGAAIAPPAPATTLLLAAWAQPRRQGRSFPGPYAVWGPAIAQKKLKLHDDTCCQNSHFTYVFHWLFKCWYIWFSAAEIAAALTASGLGLPGSHGSRPLSEPEYHLYFVL